MSSSKRDTPSSRTSPMVSFVLPEMPLTPASLLSNASSRRQTARSTLLKATRLANMNNNNNNSNNRNSNSNSCHTTPKAAETPSDNSMMLLPPSQTINESLSALALSASTQLEEVWDELGFSPEERADQLTDLLSSFRRLCEEKIESEQLVASNYRQMIVEYKEELRATSSALKIDIDESLLKEDSGMTLQDEVMTLELKLEDLRSIADIAKNELIKYKDKLADDHEALGLTFEESWLDVSSDLTRDRVLQFRDKVEEVKVAVLQRTSTVVQLLKDCQELIKLCCVSQENELDYKIMNSLVEGEDGAMTIVSKFESESCTGISAKTLDNLTHRLCELHSEKKRRKAILNDMAYVIGEMWEKLDIPKEEQKKFAESVSVSGLGDDTIRKGEEEMERLRELKSAMMGKFILKAREEIQNLWNETNASEAQRESFQGMNIQNEADFNDELLTEHEEYIEVLLTRLELMRPILDLISKRENILAERMQYEEFLKDPDRLKQQGAVKQIMKEERMSRRIQKDLPKYTDRLKKKLKEWSTKNDEDFIYNGEAYLDIMSQQEEVWMKYKDDQMKLKLEKKQKLRTGDKSSGGYRNMRKTSGTSTSSAPLADKTNRSRPISRHRGISRGRKREEPSNLQKTNRDKSRGKSRAESRVRGNASRGRAITSSKGVGVTRPGAYRQNL